MVVFVGLAINEKLPVPVLADKPKEGLMVNDAVLLLDETVRSGPIVTFLQIVISGGRVMVEVENGLMHTSSNPISEVPASEVPSNLITEVAEV